MKKADVEQRYEDDRLYCPECTEQPDYFHEVMAVSRTTPKGDHIQRTDGEGSHFECPECGRVARWGWELNR